MQVGYIQIGDLRQITRYNSKTAQGTKFGGQVHHIKSQPNKNGVVT